MTCIYCDNQSCIKLSENPVFHDKSKHIEIKYQYIRDMVEKGAAIQGEVQVLQRQAWSGPS